MPRPPGSSPPTGCCPGRALPARNRERPCRRRATFRRRSLPPIHLARDPRRLYGYPGPAGLVELREAVARLLRRNGLDVAADEVVATNGTQQAVALVAAWAREHDRPVLCETPTYAGIPGAFLVPANVAKGR